MSRHVAASLSAAGLFAGAIAWALHQQVGIVMASWSCGAPAGPGIWVTGIVAVLFLVVGTVLSIPALRGGGSAPARPRPFMALVSVMAAALFFFALALQAAAPLFLPGCEG